ncbi:MAG: hypothetical protein EZS26_001795 [Candidatus Ordinivivax streblomastigis]|uniref:Secretion system C-terminal sorting domain-containing protein n=1 Tax=Candidatus Ordinivivax streblomastigis TaxID=2540710 RepID=A0A5M8P0N0_9BACT|nr:MAG: hypothetical protein EZS26_001795 [Candidatus Ordinivivax streblomastigis]
MRKKHLLVVACMVASIFGAQAQWSDSYQPRTADLAANNDIVTIDAGGNVIVAGAFTEDFSFGTTDLSPVAQSIYVVKYSAAGEKLSAIAIQGAATVTALTTDPDGNIYIAGNFADEVIFGSTDNNTQTKTGIMDGDLPIEDLGACFLAKYSPAGVLLNVEAYVPEPLNISDTEIMYDGYNNLKCIITHLEFSGNKLYASVVTTGIIENNGITLNGTYYDIFGFMYENIQSAALISFNETLQFSKLYAKLCPPDGEEFQFNVQYPQFTKSGDIIYFAALTLGNQELTINGAKENINFNFDGENFSEGYVIAKINATTEEKVSVQTFEATAQEYYLQSERTLDGLFLNNDKLLLTGIFDGNLTFDKTIDVEDQDVFVVSLNTNNLSQVVSAKQSERSGDEEFAASAIYDGKLNIAYNDITNYTSGIFSVSLTDAATSVAPEATESIYINSFASKNGKLVKVKATTSAEDSALSTITVSAENVSTGIHHPNNTKSPIRIYPNPVASTIYLSETGTIAIYNALGILVKQAVAVNQLNVNTLPAGVYFATVKSADTIGKVTFIKE